MPDSFWTGLFGLLGLCVTGMFGYMGLKLQSMNKKMEQQTQQLVHVAQAAEETKVMASEAKVKAEAVQLEQREFFDSARTDTFELKQLIKSQSDFGRLT